MRAARRSPRAPRASTSGARRCPRRPGRSSAQTSGRSTRIRWKRSCWRSSRRFQGRTCSAPARPGPGVELAEPALLERARGASAGSSVSPGSTPPPGVAHQASWLTGFSKLQQEHALVAVDDERAHRLARHRLEPFVERAEPAEPLGDTGRPRSQARSRGARRAAVCTSVAQLRRRARGARRRGRGRPPCRRRRSRAARSSRASPREPAGVEVAAAQVTRAGSRPVGGVRDAVAELEQRRTARRGRSSRGREARRRAAAARSRCAGSRSARAPPPRRGRG